jgi:hypothetical protein
MKKFIQAYLVRPGGALEPPAGAAPTDTDIVQVGGPCE